MIKCKTTFFLVSLLALSSNLAAALPLLAEISLTAQPQKWVMRFKPYLTIGYGNASFGMSQQEVRNIIAQDYASAMPSLRDTFHEVNRTPLLSLVVNELAPGPGPATITFVFGARSQKLIAVNVYWLVPGVATPAQQQQLIEAASTVTAGLLEYRWPLLAVSRGIVPVPGVLLVFSGKDMAGGGAEVRLNGVGVDIEKPNTTAQSLAAREHRPAPPGPAQLHLSFVANIEQPDIH
jgi:hypothetical protein